MVTDRYGMSFETQRATSTTKELSGTPRGNPIGHIVRDTLGFETAKLNSGPFRMTKASDTLHQSRTLMKNHPVFGGQVLISLEILTHFGMHSLHFMRQ